MKTHESAENYLETILVLYKRRGSVRAIDIVHELGYSKPSVSVAMKNLREQGMITVATGGLIALTEKGLMVASTMYERHNLLSDWLFEMGVSRETATEDACRIEHVISAESFEALRAHKEKYKN